MPTSWATPPTSPGALPTSGCWQRLGQVGVPGDGFGWSQRGKVFPQILRAPCWSCFQGAVSGLWAELLRVRLFLECDKEIPGLVPHWGALWGPVLKSCSAPWASSYHGDISGVRPIPNTFPSCLAEILSEDGTINRKVLGAKVFGNQVKAARGVSIFNLPSSELSPRLCRGLFASQPFELLALFLAAVPHGEGRTRGSLPRHCVSGHAGRAPGTLGSCCCCFPSPASLCPSPSTELKPRRARHPCPLAVRGLGRVASGAR